MNNPKSLITNVVALALLLLGLFIPENWFKAQVFAVGIFALSGALTNWLAVYMLFEKVPGLYGSGVVPSRFEEFKVGIRALIMGQFFSQENLERFLANAAAETSQKLSSAPISGMIDHEKMFANLVEVIKESSFGGMLGMLGGEAALEPLREPFQKKMDEIVEGILISDAVAELISSGGMSSEAWVEKIDIIVTERLNELTPQMVKEIVQDMIEKHLGWLVVWGGVFGGVIGLISSLVWPI